MPGTDSPHEEHLDALLADALSLVREWLSMEIAYVTEFVGDAQVIAVVDGEGDSFSLQPGTRVRLDDSYCQRMLSGEIENVVPDAAGDPCVGELAATRDSAIGAYIGVPIVLPTTQRLHGTLCCLSHEARPELGERDLRFVRVVARLVANEIERDRSQALAVNEKVVQQLSLAIYSLDGGDADAARDCVGAALEDARRMATELIGRAEAGDLRA